MVPDRLVILTFDDGKKSDFTFVGPLLKRHGFGATFFVTEGLGFHDKEKYLTWEEIISLQEAGFEIGNHTARHRDVREQSADEFRADLRQLESRCQEHGISRPTTFAYPGSHVSRVSVQVLSEEGYKFARRGVFPEFPRDKTGECGPVYDPEVDHPLLVPTTGMSGVRWTLDEFVKVIDQAHDGKIAVLCFHGVPCDHPTASTDPAKFETFMAYLYETDCTVVALRDLEKYVECPSGPADPFEPIEQQVGVILTSF